MALLERTDADGIAHLNLNAPEKLNALSEAMLDALQEQFDALQDDRAVRAVIISGSGKAFCAGHDLKEICLLYTSPSPRDRTRSRMPSSA